MDTSLSVHGLLLLAWLWAAPARAQTPDTSRRMHPGHLDLHVEGGLSFIPPSFEAAIRTELGVAPLGPGTLSAGAQLGLRHCVLACSVSGLLAQQRSSDRDVSVLGHLGYHFELEGKGKDKVDLYGVLLGGVIEARTTREAATYRYEGRGRGLAFGLGVGGNYFLSPRLFLGCEARVSFASGVYALALSRGDHTFTSEDRRLSRLGLGTVLFAGVRLF